MDRGRGVLRVWGFFLLWLIPASVFAQTSGEERFFAQCIERPRLRVHQEGRLLDLHVLLYTTANLMELEVIRLADWVIDAPLPGSLRPLERTINGIRSVYHRVDEAVPIARAGELVDALQLRELSLGDAGTTYTVTAGGTVSPGGGTVVRINRLIDWSQHLVGDANALAGRPIGRGWGLIRWALPGRCVDGAQTVLTRLFHGLTIIVARVADRGVVSLEQASEAVLNAPTPSPHRMTTVFLRFPNEVYAAHRGWLMAHRARIYVGTSEQLSELTHERVFHPTGLYRRRIEWWREGLPQADGAPLVMVADRRTFARAPKALVPYVIPAAWALEGVTEDH